METHLPIDDLKKYGIIDQELSFSKKLNEEDIQKFLKGFIMVAENDKHRITFQLQNHNLVEKFVLMHILLVITFFRLVLYSVLLLFFLHFQMIVF